MSIHVHSYAPSTLAGPDRYWLTKAACLCGLLPLIVGVGCFAGWAVFGSSIFMGAGVATILGGLLLFGAGSISLLTDYILRLRRQPIPRHWLPIRRQWIAVVILVSNVPALIAVMAAVDYINHFYVVTFDNQSSLPLDELVLTSDPSKETRILDLPARQAIRKNVWINGPFTCYTLTQGSTKNRATLPPMVKTYSGHGNPFHHDMTVTIHADRSVTVAFIKGPAARAHMP